MRRTMRWPPDLSQGRAAMTPDPRTSTDGEALRPVIALAHGGDRSAHPWDAVEGLVDAAPTWARRDEPALRARVERVFARLAGDRRAELRDLAIVWADGAVLIRIDYVDLEAGRRPARVEARYGA